MAPERLAIVGTGLIGASVALAAKRGRDVSIAGFDPDPVGLRAAVERGAVDSGADSLEAALAHAELAVVAAPVAQLAAQVRAALEASPEGCTVTDVGSTKAAVCAAAQGSPRFVGGHPVCGSEARGAEHASADLFDGATWFLTPLAETDPARYRLPRRPPSRRTRSRALPARARLRLGPRRDSGRRRSAGSRPPGSDHQPPAARPGEP